MEFDEADTAEEAVAWHQKWSRIMAFIITPYLFKHGVVNI
jgi:hypothetical protein